MSTLVIKDYPIYPSAYYEQTILLKKYAEFLGVNITGAGDMTVSVLEDENEEETPHTILATVEGFKISLDSSKRLCHLGAVKHNNVNYHFFLILPMMNLGTLGKEVLSDD